MILKVLSSLFYCCDNIFMIILLWITTVYKMCYINELALPITASIIIQKMIKGWFQTASYCTTIKHLKSIWYY